ncbi:hypothetical protein DEO72_LG7g2384 [Vigna unguiculata]|uniref:Disease resistance protein At4g27190-like leucine-rich repeats domain-containing protein n=1 Tax=Vigna unguiculata TaxID=3917 RepID=A0A4D6MKF9_VIGUN|nr:hypothetical protein DEO72_LG7g2384 [Vigna unguiculata]
MTSGRAYEAKQGACNGYRLILQLLEVLQINECNSLRHIIEEESDFLSSTQTPSLTLQKLRTLLIDDCDNLEYIFSVFLFEGLENDILWLISNTLKQLEDDPLSHPKLKLVLKFRSLWLSDLRIKAELNFIWKGPTAFLCFQNLSDIWVIECPKLKTIFSTTVVISLPMLKDMNISTCDELEQIFDSEVFCDPSSRCSLKNLEELEIEDCCKLNSISFPRNSTLCNLKVLTISECPMLTSLFTPSVVQTLELLEVLQINECNSLRHIIEEESDFLSSTQTPSLTLQKLRTLLIDDCDNLEYIFSVFLFEGLVSLERVNISFNEKLKYVFGSEKEHNLTEYPSFEQTNIGRNLSNLDTLTLSCLPNIIDIWPEYCHAHLPSLNYLYCGACPKLSNSFIHKENDILWLISNTLKQLEDDPLSHPKLKLVLKFRSLWLSDLRIKAELNFIWKGPTAFLCFQNLSDIWVIECPKLKTIFSTTVVISLPMLKDMNISTCDELEQIFDSVTNCNKLKCLFYNISASHFTNLISLEITNCSQLHKAFDFEDEADDGGLEEMGTYPFSHN